MLHEECMTSLNEYSKEIEDNIEIIILIRTVLSSIQSYDDYIKEKERVIQSLFEIEDILRNSSQFIKKNYFLIKQFIALNKSKKGCYLYDSETQISSNPLYPPLKHTKNKKVSLIVQSFSEKPNEVICPKDKENKHRANCKSEEYSLNLIGYIEKPFDTIDEIELKEKNDIIDNIKIPTHNENGNNNTPQTIIKNEDHPKQSRKEIYVDDPYQKEYNISKTERDNREQMINIKKEFKRNSSDSNYPLHNNNKQSQNQKRKKKVAYSQLCNNEYNIFKNYQGKPITSTCSKQKIALIANMITKLKINEDLCEMMELLFGENLIDDLMNTKPDETLISAVEKSINTIELLQKKDKELEMKDKMNHQVETQFKLKPQVNFISKGGKKSIHLDYLINNNKLIIKSKGKKCQSTYKSLSSFPCDLNQSTKHHSNVCNQPYADKLLIQNGFKLGTKPRKSLSRAQKQAELLGQQKGENNLNGNTGSYSSNMNDSFLNTKGSVLSQKSNQLNCTKNNNKCFKTKIVEDYKLISYKKVSPSHKVTQDLYS